MTFQYPDYFDTKLAMNAGLATHFCAYLQMNSENAAILAGEGFMLFAFVNLMVAAATRSPCWMRRPLLLTGSMMRRRSCRRPLTPC